MIRDQILMDNRQLEPCYTCNQYGHSVSSCPQIHFSPRKAHFAKKIFFSQEEENRKTIKRRSYHTNSLVNLIHVKLSLKVTRWEVIKASRIEYADIDIYDELQKLEKDKEFFKRCPRIKHRKYISNGQIHQMSHSDHPILQTLPEGERLDCPKS